MGRDRKNEKRGGRFVRIPFSIIESDAWRTLSCPARSVHIALIHRHNGTNNGKIYLSSRDAELALGINRKTALRAFRELEGAGFIAQVKAAHLGLEGRGRATEWRLTHLPCDAKPPTNEFLKKQNPGPSSGPPWPIKRAKGNTP